MPLSKRMMGYSKTQIKNTAGVRKLIAGTNITLSPTAGTGSVTVTAAGGGGGTIGGSITDNQVAFGATTADSIEGSANLTYDGTDLTLARTADATSRGISIKDNEGTETVRLATASGDQGLLYLRGPTGGNAIYLDGNGDSYINAGDVGIGTAAPDAKLHVVGRMDLNDGSDNVGIGTDTLGSMAGSFNIAIGTDAMANVGNASYGIAIGRGAHKYGSTGSECIFIGDYAGYANKEGENIGIGRSALFRNEGRSNTAVGSFAGYMYSQTTPSIDYCTLLGANAGQNVLSGSSQVVFVGYNAGNHGTYSYNIGIGGSALGGDATDRDTDAINNIAIGQECMRAYAGKANKNVVIGHGEAARAISGSTTSEGSQNVGMGYNVFRNITTGSTNVAFGYQAGYANTTGGGNVFLGYKAGYGATATDSNKLFIANDTGTPLIGGDFSADEIYLNNKVGIGTTSPTMNLDVRGDSSGGNVCLISGTSTGSDPIFHVKDSTDTFTALFEGNRAGDQSARMELWHNPAVAHEGSHTFLSFKMNDHLGNKTTYGKILSGIDDYTDGTEDGYLAFSQMKAGTATEGMRINSTGVGIGTTAPGYKLDVRGGIKMRDENSSSQTLIIGGQNDGVSLSVYDDDAMQLQGGTVGVRFQDLSANTHLTISETGTSMALISGTNASLFLANASGTRIELFGHSILETGRKTTHGKTNLTIGGVNTATDEYRFYEIEALADVAQPGATLTTVLTLPDGVVGGERYTLTCVALGATKAGPTLLTGEVVISGSFINGAVWGVNATEITGATATGDGVQQAAIYELMWNPGTVGAVAGWMYTYNTM